MDELSCTGAVGLGTLTIVILIGFIFGHMAGKALDDD
jgi:hypothetical protein